MKIHFKSVYGPEDNKNTIEFYSRLSISKLDEFTVLDFEQKVDNSNKVIKSKIEYTENNVIIYTGVATLELEKNQVIKNKYIVDGMTVFVYTLLNEIKIKEDGLELKYFVASNKEMEEKNEFHLILSFIANE